MSSIYNSRQYVCVIVAEMVQRRWQIGSAPHSPALISSTADGWRRQMKQKKVSWYQKQCCRCSLSRPKRCLDCFSFWLCDHWLTLYSLFSSAASSLLGWVFPAGSAEAGEVKPSAAREKKSVIKCDTMYAARKGEHTCGLYVPSQVRADVCTCSYRSDNWQHTRFFTVIFKALHHTDVQVSPMKFVIT